MMRVKSSPLFEVARMFVRFDHVARINGLLQRLLPWAVITGIRPGCSLDLAWPGLTAPPAPARPVGRSVEHPG
jgi:hypothetical protein